MYNRYMRNDDGSYTRIPEEEPDHRPPRSRPPSDSGQERQDHPEAESGAHSPSGQDQSGGQDHSGRERDRGRSGPGRPDSFGPEGRDPWEGSSFHNPPPPPAGDRGDGLTGFLRHFLDRWHLDSVDTGDLLLLGLLFFLFKEDADEELLVALGLLLIL